MTKMIRGIIFIMIGLLLIWPINAQFQRTNGYRHLNDTDKFLHVPTELEVINLGSSHGLNGFDYSSATIKGYNMALAAQGFYYDYRILKQYSSHLADDAVVLLPISYFSPYQKYEGEKFDKFNKRYYRFLEPESIRFFNPLDYLRYHTFPVLFAGEHIKYLFEDRETLKADWEQIDYNKFGMDGIESEGEKRATHHIENIIRVGQDNKATALKELDNTIAFCIDNNLKPVLITMPLHDAYKKRFDNTFLNDFYQDIDTLIDKYPNAVYYDYSEFNSERTDLFMDSDHLNKKGREAFTNEVIEQLRKQGFIDL